MFAVYAFEASPDDPLAALAIGDLAEPDGRREEEAAHGVLKVMSGSSYN
jgi:hypothetical protein